MRPALRGGEKIAEGVNGEVHRPPQACAVGSEVEFLGGKIGSAEDLAAALRERRGAVSKWLPLSEGERELEAAQALSAIDPAQRTFVYPFAMCPSAAVDAPAAGASQLAKDTLLFVPDGGVSLKARLAGLVASGALKPPEANLNHAVCVGMQLMAGVRHLANRMRATLLDHGAFHDDAHHGNVMLPADKRPLAEQGADARAWLEGGGFRRGDAAMRLIDFGIFAMLPPESADADPAALPRWLGETIRDKTLYLTQVGQDFQGCLADGEGFTLDWLARFNDGAHASVLACLERLGALPSSAVADPALVAQLRAVLGLATSSDVPIDLASPAVMSALAEAWRTDWTRGEGRRATARRLRGVLSHHKRHTAAHLATVLTSRQDTLNLLLEEVARREWGLLWPIMRSTLSPIAHGKVKPWAVVDVEDPFVKRDDAAWARECASPPANWQASVDRALWWGMVPRGTYNWRAGVWVVEDSVLVRQPWGTSAKRLARFYALVERAHAQLFGGSKDKDVELPDLAAAALAFMPPRAVAPTAAERLTTSRLDLAAMIGSARAPRTVGAKRGWAEMDESSSAAGDSTSAVGAKRSRVDAAAGGAGREGGVDGLSGGGALRARSGKRNVWRGRLRSSSRERRRSPR